jgi:hypothetical protein
MKHIYANMAISALLQSATLPSGHLAIINEMQRKKGKPILEEGQLLARKVRLTGNQLTSHYTRFADAEIQRFTDQINNGGAPLLSAHVTDDTPLGAFYAAEVTRDGDNLWLDTWAYWLSNASGVELANQIDAGIINEASIGVAFSQYICSITGLDYRQSPYYAGNEYEITDPVTGQTTKRLCFVWLMDCTIREGSMCYRGAHPDTRVGGEFAATNIQLSGNSDLASIFNKQAVSAGTPKLTFALESTQPSAREKGETVNPRLLAALGLSATATEQDVLNAIQLLITANGSLQMLTQQSTPDASLAVATAWQNSHTQLSVVTAERDALRLSLEQRDLAGLIDQGHKDGKLTTDAQRDWAKTLSPAALTAFLAATPPNPVLVQPQAQEITPTSGLPSNLTEDDRMIILQMGVSEAAYVEQKAKMASA